MFSIILCLYKISRESDPMNRSHYKWPIILQFNSLNLLLSMWIRSSSSSFQRSQDKWMIERMNLFNSSILFITNPSFSTCLEERNDHWISFPMIHSIPLMINDHWTDEHNRASICSFLSFLLKQSFTLKNSVEISHQYQSSQLIFHWTISMFSMNIWSIIFVWIHEKDFEQFQQDIRSRDLEKIMIDSFFSKLLIRSSRNWIFRIRILFSCFNPLITNDVHCQEKIN